MRSISRFALPVTTLALLLTPLVASAQTGFGPSPYLQASDSPFAALTFDYFFLENFEDGFLNTTGLSTPSSVFVAGPSAFTDSVDADDGVVDGSGTSGSSLYSNGVSSTILFEFNEIALGTLPTHVGAVWTDVGAGSGSNAILEAFDALGGSLGTVTLVSPGDGGANGATAEDRFLGFSFEGGIGSFSLSMPGSVDWELDHVQYGLQSPVVVPEPGTLGLLAVGLLGSFAIRRRLAIKHNKVL